MFRLLKNFRHNILTNLRANQRVFILVSVLHVLVVVALVRAIMNGNYDGAFVCVLALILFLVPSLMEEGFRIKIPPLLEGIIYLFIYAHAILGELNHFYVTFPHWDTILHTLNGFLAAAIGLSMIDLLNRSSRRIRLSPFYLVMVAFCFSMTIGVLWEFVEFSADYLFLKDMQKDTIIHAVNSCTLDPTATQHVIHTGEIARTDILAADGTLYTIDGGYLDIGLFDTMGDLFVNFLGALTFSILGYFMLKRRDRRAVVFARDLLPRPERDDAADDNYLFSSEGFTDDDENDEKESDHTTP